MKTINDLVMEAMAANPDLKEDPAYIESCRLVEAIKELFNTSSQYVPDKGIDTNFVMKTLGPILSVTLREQPMPGRLQIFMDLMETLAITGGIGEMQMLSAVPTGQEANSDGVSDSEYAECQCPDCTAARKARESSLH